MHYISRFIAGFAIGFIRVWQISLVTLSIVPLIAIAGGVYAFVATGLIASVRKSYVKAGEIAEEVLSLSLPLLLLDVVNMFDEKILDPIMGFPRSEISPPHSRVNSVTICCF